MVERVLDRLSQANAFVQSKGAPESPLEEEVLHELQKLGYKVDCQVGESGFRIDPEGSQNGSRGLIVTCH